MVVIRRLAWHPQAFEWNEIWSFGKITTIAGTSTGVTVTVHRLEQRRAGMRIDWAEDR